MNDIYEKYGCIPREFGISDHARERFKERCRHLGDMEEVIIKSWFDGKDVKEKEFDIEKHSKHDEVVATRYREFLWIFAVRPLEYSVRNKKILITTYRY